MGGGRCPQCGLCCLLIFGCFQKIVGFPPKSSILIGFSITNHLFWGTPIFGNTRLQQWYSRVWVFWSPRNSAFGHHLSSSISMYAFIDGGTRYMLTSLTSVYNIYISLTSSLQIISFYDITQVVSHGFANILHIVSRYFASRFLGILVAPSKAIFLCKQFLY